MISRRNNHSSDRSLYLLGGNPQNNDCAPAASDFFSWDKIQKIFPYPTIITDDKLRKFSPEPEDMAFKDIIVQNGGYYFFSNHSLSKNFFDFINISQNNNRIYIKNIEQDSLKISEKSRKFLKFNLLSSKINFIICAISIIEFFDKKSFHPDLLKDLFGLTLAESRVANLLHAGLSPDEIANTCGLRVYTVRDHLGSIFTKTDTNRQSELVYLLSKLEILM